MKKNRIWTVFTFLLLIPYLCSLMIIGIGYNALVFHSESLWRSLIGSFVGAIIMLAIKATIQRPLDLLAVNIENKFFAQFLRFFSIRRRPAFQILNFGLDFILCGMTNFIIGKTLNLDTIVGNATGFVLLIMFVSTCIGAYVEYDALAINNNQPNNHSTLQS